MACEEANKEYIQAMNAYVRLEEELRDLLLSFISRPGQPIRPLVVGSREFERATQLMEERDPAYERYRTAQANFVEAKTRHRN